MTVRKMRLLGWAEQIAILSVGFAAVGCTTVCVGAAAADPAEAKALIIEDVGQCTTAGAVSLESVAAGHTAADPTASAAITQQLAADPADSAAITQQTDESGQAYALEYLGAWTTTAYCACSICCGDYADGYTASGTLAASGRTVACEALPIGAEIMIDGTIYTVEDTGVQGEWVDIYFDTHEAAVQYGIHTKDIYLVIR